MTIPHLYHSLTAIVLPLSGPVAPSAYIAGMNPKYPHGLIVTVGVDGKVVEPVYVYGWSVFPTLAQPQTADVNHDGFINGDDADLFRRWFDAGDVTADYDGDGFVTGEDFDEFMAAFQAGFVVR